MAEVHFLFCVLFLVVASWPSDTTNAEPSVTRSTLPSRVSEQPFILLGTEYTTTPWARKPDNRKNVAHLKSVSIPTARLPRSHAIRDRHEFNFCFLQPKNSRLPTIRSASDKEKVGLLRCALRCSWQTSLPTPIFLRVKFGHNTHHILLWRLSFSTASLPCCFQVVYEHRLPCSPPQTCSTSSPIPDP